MENRRRFLDDVAASLDVRQPEDWKKVTVADVREKGGAGLLKLYGYSVLAMLQAIYPEQGFTAANCRGRMPQGYWKSEENRRSFLEKLAAAHDVRTADDWAKVTPEHVTRAGGAVLLHMHGNSLQKAVAVAFPELGLPASTRKPPGYWQERKNRRAFIEEVAEKLGITSAEDWSKVTLKQVAALGGRGMLQHYSNSLQRALEDIYPGREWSDYDSAGKRRRGYWDDMANRRAFLVEYAERHGIHAAGDWKKVKWADITAAGGSSILARYNSFQEALVDVFGGEGEGVWSGHACRSRLPPSYWENDENIRRFLDAAKRELRIHSDDDWYRVSVAQIRSLNGGGLLAAMSLQEALHRAYGGSWAQARFPEGGRKRSAQRLLLGHMADIFGSATSGLHQAVQ